MNFLLSSGESVSVTIYNTEALKTQLKESFPDADLTESIPVNLDHDEYQMIILVQRGKLSLSSLPSEVFTKADAYGLLPACLVAEAQYLWKVKNEKMNQLTELLMGTTELIIVSKNKYDRLKNTLPDNIIPFVASTEDGASVIFCDNLWNDFGKIKKGQDVNRLKWETIFKPHRESYKKKKETKNKLAIKKEKFDFVDVQVDETNRLDITPGSLYNLFSNEPNRQLNALALFTCIADSDQQLDHISYGCEYSAFKKLLKETKADRDINTKALGKKVRNNISFRKETKKLKKKTQIVNNTLMSEDGSTIVYGTTTFGIYGFVRV